MNRHFSPINGLESVNGIQFSLCGIPTNLIFAHRGWIMFGCLPNIHHTAECCLPRLSNTSTLKDHFVFACRIGVLFVFRCKPGFRLHSAWACLRCMPQVFCAVYTSAPRRYGAASFLFMCIPGIGRKMWGSPQIWRWNAWLFCLRQFFTRNKCEI